MKINTENPTEAISKDRPQLKTNTIKQYVIHLNKLKKIFDTDSYDFLSKPFDTDHFFVIVARAVEKNKLEARARLFQEEYKKNLYDLNIEKSRLRTIVGYIPNGVMVTNINTEVVLINPALKRLLSISGGVPTPVPIERVLKDKSFIKLLKDFHFMLTHGKNS